jgi:hypothetical protein
MLAPKSPIVSGGVFSENIVGSNAPTNSSGERSANASACRRRCSATSAGREPAQPAYADASISVLGMAECRR